MRRTEPDAGVPVEVLGEGRVLPPQRTVEEIPRVARTTPIGTRPEQPDEPVLEPLCHLVQTEPLSRDPVGNSTVSAAADPAAYV